MYNSNIGNSKTGIITIGHNPAKELRRHLGYGQAGRRKLGSGRDAGAPGRNGRFVAVDGRIYTGPCKARTLWLIHLRYGTKKSLIFQGKSLDNIGRTIICMRMNFCILL